jgi:hypothetical protein
VPSAGADDPAGDVQQSQAKTLGFPGPGGGPGQGEVLGPGDQVRGQGDEFEPDLIGGEAVQRQVAQPGVFQAADAVLGAGPLAVQQLVVGRPSRWSRTA